MALREALKIKLHDKHIRLITHEPHRFICPPNIATPGVYTLVSIDTLAGRSLDAKRNLYKAIVKNLKPLSTPKVHTKILLREIPTSDWGGVVARPHVTLIWCSKNIQQSILRAVIIRLSPVLMLHVGVGFVRRSRQFINKSW